MENPTATPAWNPPPEAPHGHPQDQIPSPAGQPAYQCPFTACPAIITQFPSLKPQMPKHQNKKVCLIQLVLPISGPLGGLWCKVAHFWGSFTACLWFCFLGYNMIVTSEDLLSIHLLSSFQNLFLLSSSSFILFEYETFMSF